MLLNWVLFVVHLPGRQSAPRMRVWRALKTTGAALLRDGVYLVVENAYTAPILAQYEDEIAQLDGTAYRFAVTLTTAQQAGLQALFNRNADYHAIAKKAQALLRQLPHYTEGRARRRLGQLLQDWEQLKAIDFFGNTQQQAIDPMLRACSTAIERQFNNDEPAAQPGSIPHCDRNHFQARQWATRQNMWVDRIASAWLIRRFIDPQAQFVWLQDPAQCPDTALGFDFNGARFTHIGDKVTFEVLLASFGLGNDPGLQQLGAMVHYLDVGGTPVAEADGFTAILTGAKARCADDDALLNAITPILDDLHHAYSQHNSAKQ